MFTIDFRAAAMAAALLPFLAAAAPLTLESALDLAVQRSQATRAARVGVAGAAEAAQAAGELPDPMLRVGIENLPATGRNRFSTTRDSQTMKRIGVSQEWLSRDKRALRRAAADASVDREAMQGRIAAAEARLQTALAFLDTWYAGEALKLTTLTEHHVHEELEASRGRLAAAAGASAEVLALSAAQGMAEDESAELRQQQGSAAATLQRWVGQAPDELAVVSALAVPSEQAYVAAHPAVQALERDIELARRTAAVTASERRPNWTWELAYGQRTGDADMVSFGVSIPLQIAPGERQDRDTAAKLALVQKAQADLEEAMRAATAEYLVLSNDARRLQARIKRYRSGVLMPAQQRSAAAVAAYRSNQSTLASLFEARHAEVEAQRKLLTLQRDLAQTEARLAFKPVPQGVAP